MSEKLDPTLQRELEWPAGDYNDTATVTATEKGIELDHLGFLSWEWIDAARQRLAEIKTSEAT
jgi:hypothetical protein